MEHQKKAIKKKGSLRHKGSFFDFLCGVPALVFFAIFTYYPVLDLFRISLTDWNLTRKTFQYVGIKNYNWLFRGSGWEKFVSSMGVTVLYTLGEVAIAVIGGILLALLFNRMTKLFGAMRVAVVIPKYIAAASTAMIFMWLYNSMHGVFNYILGLAGIAPVDWLGSSSSALSSLIFFGGWRSVGYAMLIYLSAIRGISPEYLEAAEIDGANGWEKLRYIMLPLLAPTTLFMAITTITSSMKVFQAVDILTNGGPYGSTNMLVYYVYKLAFVDFRLDRAAAVGVVFFLVLLAFTAATMKWSDRKVNYDA